MRITCATEGAPGHVNEDYVLCGNDWVVVLDGATAPPGADSGCIHDVVWLVRHLAAALARRMILDASPLTELLAEAISETRDAHTAACDLSNPDSPSSTVSIVRVRGDALDYLTLADSPVVIRGADRSLAVITDDRLAHLPGGRPYPAELVRSLRNERGGFWVASTETEAAYHAVTGSAAFHAGTEVGIFTDGISRLVESYGYGWEHVFSILETIGPDSVIALVRDAERARPLPGVKQHDDASAVLMASGSVTRPTQGRAERPANWRDLVGMLAWAT